MIAETYVLVAYFRTAYCPFSAFREVVIFNNLFRITAQLEYDTGFSPPETDLY